MEHLAIMQKGYIEKILCGEKKIESRFSKNKIAPYKRIAQGDRVYLQEAGKEVTAAFEVKDVLFFDDLDEEKIEAIRMQYGKDICAADEFWKIKKSSRYASLIYIKDPVKVAPFKVYKHDRSAFKSVDHVKSSFVLPKRTIQKHPHDCKNNQHYYIFDGNTHCEFCNQVFPYTDVMLSRPDYTTVKEIMKQSKWNDEWLNVDLDGVAKGRLSKIKTAEIKKILTAKISIRRENDGRQTPYYGNPVFYAQHGLGCCCRKCLEKFYNIPQDRVLSDEDLEYFTNLIAAYLKEKQSLGIPR